MKIFLSPLKRLSIFSHVQKSLFHTVKYAPSTIQLSAVNVQTQITGLGQGVMSHLLRGADRGRPRRRETQEEEGVHEGRGSSYREQGTSHRDGGWVGVAQARGK